ncbi:MAG: UbiX family flavin prenyltransferase [Candidatus Bathyarchaeia archaeon]
MKLVVGLSGASGIMYGIRLLQILGEKNVETHLVISPAAERLIKIETDYSLEEVRALATQVYGIDDLEAPISSGSCLIDGMIITPCSMKTLSGIACGYSTNLLLRAADVTLKEKRKLILVPREAPLNVIHLENMLRLAKLGAVILPAMPAFYIKPQTVSQLIDFMVGRILDILGIEHNLYPRWGSRS